MKFVPQTQDIGRTLVHYANLLRFIENLGKKYILLLA